MSEIPPPLSYEQASRILAKLADLEHPVVLVGGQALNFWASYYEHRVVELAAGSRRCKHAQHRHRDVPR